MPKMTLSIWKWRTTRGLWSITLSSIDWLPNISGKMPYFQSFHFQSFHLSNLDVWFVTGSHEDNITLPNSTVLGILPLCWSLFIFVSFSHQAHWLRISKTPCAHSYKWAFKVVLFKVELWLSQLQCCVLDKQQILKCWLWPLCDTSQNPQDVTNIVLTTSVATALAGFFANFANKIGKILKIFERLEDPKRQGVTCQH